jgi:RNA polymerase sigma-70 factor (ECF subfamily)
MTHVSTDFGLGIARRLGGAVGARLESLRHSEGFRSVSIGAEPTLLQRVASGEEGAVRACIDQYAGLVWSLARRMCPTRSDAEDAVQDIYIALWKSAGRYDPGLGSEPTFVAMIARRRLIDRARRAGRRPGMSSLIEEAAGEGGGNGRGGKAPESVRMGGAIEASEDVRRAQEMLGELSAEQQRVIKLAVYYGLSHEKIAASTDLPLGTVKTHIRRGLIKLRKLLGENGERRAEAGTDAWNGSDES